MRDLKTTLNTLQSLLLQWTTEDRQRRKTGGYEEAMRRDERDKTGRLMRGKGCKGNREKEEERRVIER